MPTFGTVCDGIGCGHLAFNRAGFDCAWSFEIEAFPSAVLAYRFPDVKNHGDMLKCVGMIESGEIEAPDVFIGGTPCQAFSVAGKRKGLEDARGNLSLAFCGIADAIDDVRGRDGKPPCAVLWENVPGVLSDKGNAFGCFLGELSGAGCEIKPPGGKWGNAGCVFGPKRTAAFRVLDSQYYGVAQRRRRVFVVASAGEGARPEEILFEREGLRRDSPPSREKREGAPRGIEIGPSGGCFTDSNPTLDARCKDGPIRNQLAGAALDCQTYDMRGNGDGVTVGCLTGDHAGRPTDYTPVVVFEPRFVRTSGGQPSIELNPCLRADANTGDGAPCMAHGQGGAEIADNRAPTLTCNHEDTAFALGRNHGQENAVCVTGDITHTLKAEGFDGSEDGTGRGQPIVLAFVQNSRDEVRLMGGDGQIIGALTAEAGMKQQCYVTAPAVRRLTPRECERLQALPEDWTKIPWRGKPAEECPDGPRYKGIGNGQTVTVMEWLARRIMAEMTR